MSKAESWNNLKSQFTKGCQTQVQKGLEKANVCQGHSEKACDHIMTVTEHIGKNLCQEFTNGITKAGRAAYAKCAAKKCDRHGPACSKAC